MRHPVYIFTRPVISVLLLFVALHVSAQTTDYVRRNDVRNVYRQHGYSYDVSQKELAIQKETGKTDNTKSATFLLRTNGLYDLALCPNVGLEFQTDLGLAFQLDYIGAWWNSPSRNRYFSNYGFQSEIRYYFTHDDYSVPFTGIHAGVYGQMATFDFEFGGKGIQCPNLDDAWGIGLSGGYTMPISRRWAIDFTLGVGFFTAKYTKYDPTVTGGYVATGLKRLKFFGPTKAEVTFVWSLNKDNKRK